MLKIPCSVIWMDEGSLMWGSLGERKLTWSSIVKEWFLVFLNNLISITFYILPFISDKTLSKPLNQKWQITLQLSGFVLFSDLLINVAAKTDQDFPFSSTVKNKNFPSTGVWMSRQRIWCLPEKSLSFEPSWQQVELQYVFDREQSSQLGNLCLSPLLWGKICPLGQLFPPFPSGI